jgi:hypothetical protein
MLHYLGRRVGLSSHGVRRHLAYGALGCAAFSCTLALAVASCSERGPAPPREGSITAPAPARGASLSPALVARAERSAAIVAAHGDALVALAGPNPGGTSAQRRVSVEVPSRADGRAVVRDDARAMAIGFRLEGAAARSSVVIGELSIFPAAAPSEGDLVQRVGAAGIEDLVLYEREPPATELVYHVDLEGVAGLRLVARTLELLDRSGVPRLRVAPPYVVDAGGRRLSASLELQGCRADHHASAPWDRAPTAPGARDCLLRVRWDRGLAYPAVIDPTWVATEGLMLEPRSRPAVAEVAPGSSTSVVLVSGGYDTAGDALDSAELYHPLHRTFAATGTLVTARGGHSLTPLATIPASGAPVPLLCAGGSDDEGGAGLASLEIYDPSSGEFVNEPKATAARVRHTATLIANATVLIAGGRGATLPVASAERYQFNGFTGGPPDSTLATVDTMDRPRARHTAVRLASGKVLVAGGQRDAVNADQTAELFDPVGNTFGPISELQANPQMLRPRMDHAAVELADGSVLITGGTNGTVFFDDVDIYRDEPGTVVGFEFQTVPITMEEARANHTSTLLSSGKVVLAGGQNSGGTLGVSEVYDHDDKTFDLGGVAIDMTPRRAHAALAVNAGFDAAGGRAVLALGGRDPANIALATAQLYIKPNGDACSLAAECASGHCAPTTTPAGGVCCDTACDQQCYACTAAAKESGVDDGICGPAALDTPLPVSCVDEVEVHNVCDGSGLAITSLAKDCKPSTCNAAETSCASFCDAENPCSASGWCDFSDPPGTGGGGGSGGAGGDGGAPGGGGAGGDATGGSGGAGGSIPSDAGTCKDRLPRGAPCAFIEQCEEGLFCVDGHCCDTACSGQCQACDILAGTCTTVPADEQPHPDATGAGRAACNGAGSACGGVCNGQNPLACSYPGVEAEQGARSCTCPNGDCDRAAVEVRQVCNGDGSAEPQEVSCAGFRCDDGESGCRTSCSSDDECLLDYICENAVCSALEGPSCDGEHTVRIPSGDDTDCTPFTCDVDSDACRDRCSSINDCVAPAVCNTAGACVTAPQAPEVASCSCELPGGAQRDDAPRWLWLAAVAGLAGLWRSRRKARHSASARPA